MCEFPVMFFDGSPFSSWSSVALVSAEELQTYEASAHNLIVYSH